MRISWVHIMFEDTNMKTKLLLVGAALGLAVATASAADPIYSSNVVGYVNVDLVAGWNMIANPLDSGDNVLGNLFPEGATAALPNGSALYKFTNGAYDITTYDYDDFEEIYVWGKPNMALNPGEGAFIKTPEAATVTFVGQIVAGSYDVALSPGWNMISSPTPVAGTQDEIGLSKAVTVGDALYAFSASTQSYSIATYDYDEFEEVNVWSKDINIGVGDAFFLKAANAGTWTRTFEIK